MNAWLILVPLAVILGLDVLAVALCRAAARGDEQWRRAARHRNGGWSE